MLFKLAWRNLWRNRRRTLITIASVFFAVLLSVLMRSFQEGSYEVMIRNVVSFYTGYAQIHKEGYWAEQTLDNSFEPAEDLHLAAGPDLGVRRAVPRLESFALASSGDNTRPAMVVGIDPEAEPALTNLDQKLSAGAYFTGTAPAALVAEDLAEKLGLGVGDTLLLIGQGYQGVSAGGRYPIAGLLHFGSPELNKRMVYLPLPEAQYLYGAENRLTSYALVLENPDQTGRVVRALDEALPGSYEVMTWQELQPELVEGIEGDRAGGVITLTILYVIIGFGMFGTVLMMTAERQYEFGVMTAIGMSKLRQSLVIFIEISLMGLLGVLAGLAASLPLTWYFKLNPIYMGEQMAEVYAQFDMEPVLPASTDPGIFLQQAVIVFLLSLAISLYPIWNIQRLQPVRAMRS
ncbi:MAG: FtsX-like permease family protein [Bacteroidia bacterium]|nr:FtsX-like permease family protein [Bacteroidia bacterium]